MADKPGERLAARLRQTIDKERDEERQKEEARRQREEAARQARAALLRDLADFGRAVGHFDVAAAGGQLTLRYGGRSLRFESEGDIGLVRVTGEGLKGEVTLELKAAIDKWVVRQVPEKGRERERLLFDGGLEDLVGIVLGVKIREEAPG